MVESPALRAKPARRANAAWRAEVRALAQVAGGIAGTFVLTLGVIWLFLLVAF